MSKAEVAASTSAFPPELRRPVTAPGTARRVAAMDGAGLVASSSALRRPEFQAESRLFQRIVYKNRNQHRRGHYWRHLTAVHARLRTLASLQLPDLLLGLHAMSGPGRDKAEGLGNRPGQPRSFPSAQAGVFACRRLLAGLDAGVDAVGAIDVSSASLMALLGQSFFMPFALTATAALARLRALLAQLLVDIQRAYNAVAELLPHLPRAPARAQPAPAAHASFKVAAEAVLAACSGPADAPHPAFVPRGGAHQSAALPAVVTLEWDAARVAAVRRVGEVRVEGVDGPRGRGGAGPPAAAGGECAVFEDVGAGEDVGVAVSRHAVLEVLEDEGGGGGGAQGAAAEAAPRYKLGKQGALGLLQGASSSGSEGPEGGRSAGESGGAVGLGDRGAELWRRANSIAATRPADRPREAAFVSVGGERGARAGDGKHSTTSAAGPMAQKQEGGGAAGREAEARAGVPGDVRGSQRRAERRPAGGSLGKKKKRRDKEEREQKKRKKDGGDDVFAMLTGGLGFS
ncbi:unnamed protein product [Pedinophyceae sp. YPF-701]|nr:unnamed protein product [Pedinophyceae sp. YPF-701]